MKEPGLDNRHRDKNGKIQHKRSDTQNQNLPSPIPGDSRVFSGHNAQDPQRKNRQDQREGHTEFSQAQEIG